MKEIRTVEELANYLDSDLGWRKKELTYIVNLVKSESERNVDTQLRIGITILYAHWEGYIKNAGTFYVRYIKQLKLKYEDLGENFIALALRGTFSECLKTDKTSIHATLVDILVNDLSDIADLPHHNVINTQSNLKWDVFKEVLDTLGLEDSFYSTKDKQINKLVDHRNEVAHGKRPHFDEILFFSLYNEVIKMLDCFKDQIIQSASTEKFKRNLD
ncbi:MAG: MAE_28990/MAE_18760 family HEPN-like nuclease [Euryarchaeota archaeon]|nr:MAE_28990/MAE_18760 family HEPN-like nuclease [Euryarchaeota archaeon]